MKRKKKAESDTANVGYNSFSETSIWALYPNTINILQAQRLIPKTAIDRRDAYEKNRGLNATIILLSALSIEGFLVDCLSTFMPGSRIHLDDNFQSRLDFEFTKRVVNATFSDFPELFTLTLGKPLSKLIKDQSLVAGVLRLIDFRNGLAHSRPVVYLGLDHEFTTVDGATDYMTEYKMDKQYETVHAYLEARGLIFERQDLFRDDIADHFVGFVRPYMDAVLLLLPADNVSSVKHLVATAFRKPSQW